MFGQGRPIEIRRLVFTRLALVVRALLVCAMVALAAESAPGQNSLQLRIAWGGGAKRLWSGTIALTEGQLRLHRPLGIEADEPGSIWVEQNRLEIRQRSPREYDGADVFVEAPLEAKLLLSISADPRQPPVYQEIRLADLVQKPFSRSLDEHNNRLLVRRAPGDMLRVRLPRDCLVFSCGERIVIDVWPNLLPVGDGANVRLRSKLVANIGGEEHWSQVNEVTRPAGDSTAPAIVSLDFLSPGSEGVYDLFIEAIERNPLRWSKPIASRHVQLVVIGERAAVTASDQAGWSKVFEIDPANPGWAERLKSLPLMPGWRQGSLGNGHTHSRQHPLGTVVQLDAVAVSDDLAWEAYPLEIENPGQPHVLEVEFPSDVAQTLGISVLEPNAAGQVTPIGLDSGVYVSDPPQSTAPQWNKHRLVFWPRSENPLLLLTNRGAGEAAAYGKIRVLAGPSRLPPAFHRAFDRSERLFAAYLDRPLFNENFGAAESLDSWSGRSLDDWQTFYEGATRLVEYLEHAGYNGLMLTVLADGSTIYPSQELEPTPRYDSGAFFDSGQDPFRKDGIELLLRLFDNEGIKLIPSLQFSAPLPALEAPARRSDPQTSGLVLVGADGRPWTATNVARQELAPYYNPLNPQVQEAMLAVVREVVQRYARHPSFSGLAVALSADGYAQLPGEAWGFDDATIAAFERDKGTRVPGAGPQRFAQRAQHLLGAERKVWLEWRAEKLADFHLRMQQELARLRPDALFYLAATNMFDAPEARRDLLPALTHQGGVADALLSLGIRPELYHDRDGLVFVRPQRITPPTPVAAHALDFALAASAELDRLAIQTFAPASLFFHEPSKIRLPSFEVKSPFGKEKTYAWLVSQMSPAGAENRQRFARSLARLDSQAMFDGGWMLALGQEESLAPWIATFRRLPAARFETVISPWTERGRRDEPVTVRTLARDGQRFYYFVNESPWPLTLAMNVQSPRGVPADELSGLRRLPPIVDDRWTIALEPFDVIAVRFASQDVRLSQFAVIPPDNLLADLQQRIESLQHRRAILQNPPTLTGLKNPGFETATRGRPANWTLTAEPQASATAQVERGQGFQGTNGVRLESGGRSAAFFSEPFRPPRTGRLSLSVRLRVDNPQEQPSVRLAVEGTLDGATYSPFAFVGAAASAAPIPSDWSASQFILKIDDMPASGLSDLRVRIDITGPGAVWIDDVQLFHLDFSTKERYQLGIRLGLPQLQLSEGRWGDCQRELEGYWPRFLTANIPLAAQPLAGSGDTPAGGKQAARPRPIERMKDWLKR